MTTHVDAAPGGGFGRRRVLPTTRMGRIACWLALAFAAWLVANTAIMGISQSVAIAGAARIGIIALSWVGLACGIAGGVVALLAVVRRHERGLLVFAAMLPGLFVLTFLLGELLLPH